jgi:hypothetical protein
MFSAQGMIREKKQFYTTLILLAGTVLLIGSADSVAKTRWSSLHIVPDADLFGTGEVTVGFDGYLCKDTAAQPLLRPSFPLVFGITEWINVEIGYAGGMTMGLKGRILGETGRIWPSIAIGVHNLISQKEVNYFAVDSAKDMTGEVYLAISKGVDPIKTRFHIGIQSIPTSENDKINPYFAVEKYFGLGLYASLEFFMRQKSPVFCLFANWRLWKNHIEISGGAVDLKSMFLDENNALSVSLTPAHSDVFVKPGFWFGIKVHTRFGLGNNKGFTSAEDRLKKQDEQIEKMQKEMEALTNRVGVNTTNLDSLDQSVKTLVDSVANDPKKIKNLLYAKMIGLKTLYSTEPFDPDKVKLAVRELVMYREKAVPSLIDFMVDKKMDRYIRMNSIAILGEIANTSYSDILLDELTRTNDPDIKIEILIALGKMKETRAMYLMEQLANSPNDAIALTAQEVLFRLSKVTGAKISSDIKIREISMQPGVPVKFGKGIKEEPPLSNSVKDTTVSMVRDAGAVNAPATVTGDTTGAKADQIVPLKGMSKGRIDSLNNIQSKIVELKKDSAQKVPVKKDSLQVNKPDTTVVEKKESAVKKPPADSVFAASDSSAATTGKPAAQKEKKTKKEDKQNRKEKRKADKEW